MKRLRSCEGCSRHVFVTERTCPFCQRALAAVPEQPVVQYPAGSSRAQRLALAAALTGQALAGCAETTAIPVYGAPVPVAGSAGTSAPAAGAGAGAGAGGRAAAGGGSGRGAAGQLGVPVYGAPVYGAPIAGQPAPMKDAGAPPDDEDAGSVEPVPPRDAGQAQPVYGAPPIQPYGATPTPTPKP